MASLAAAAPPSVPKVTVPEALSAGTLVVPLTVSVVPTVEAVRPMFSSEVPPRFTDSSAEPLELAVPLTARPTTSSPAVSTCNCAVGMPVPMPIRPSGVMRIRSTSSSRGRVENRSGLAAPRAVRAMRPLLAVRPISPLLAVKPSELPVMPGALTTELAAKVVNAPEARLLAPMLVALMAPPPKATLSDWNCPPRVTIARTKPFVTKRRSLLLVVPRYLPVGASPRPPPLAVMGLPVSAQA